MTEYLEDSNLLEGQRITNSLQKLEALTKYVATSESDKVVIKQNNTIIILLLTLHKKIELLEKKLDKRPETNLENLTNNIDSLSHKLINLNLKEIGRERITRKPIKALSFPKIELTWV